MDLRHVRTFVTVAELGTVSKAALHLRVAQPALSRQISDLEQELGLKLFDRVGRRLLLTGEGEQLLADCRGLLNYATGVGERAQDLRRGDVGVLKVAATPLHIEGVFSQFLHRYAERYPNVQVRVTEGSGSRDPANVRAWRDTSWSNAPAWGSTGRRTLREPATGTGRTPRRVPSVSDDWQATARSRSRVSHLIRCSCLTAGTAFAEPLTQPAASRA